LREARVHVIHAAEFDNVETAKRAVEIDNGLSIVPSSTVTREVKNGLLSAIELEESVVRPLGYILSRSRARPPGLKQFIDALQNTAMASALV
jgi:DNA-binding transcriptional LysR family regulator